MTPDLRIRITRTAVHEHSSQGVKQGNCDVANDF